MEIENNPKIEFEYVSWEKIHEICIELYTSILEDGFKPDLLIGVARGGWGPARLLSDLFNDVHIASMKIEFYTDIYETKKRPKVTQPVSTEVSGKAVLVVDDVADTGLSLRAAIEHLEGRNAREVRTLTLYYKQWSEVKPEYYARETQAWVVFAHEIAEFMRLRINTREKEGASFEIIRNEFTKLGLPQYMINFIESETAERSI